MEDYALILDYLPQGIPTDKSFRREPWPMPSERSSSNFSSSFPRWRRSSSSVTGSISARILPFATRSYVKRRVGYEELTAAAQAELPFVLQDIVKQQQERFIKFFNEAQAITTRFHMLGSSQGWARRRCGPSSRSGRKGRSPTTRTLSREYLP